MNDALLPPRDGLVIDSHPRSRRNLGTMLRQFGVLNVTETARLAEARQLLARQPFDIVLCDYHFEEENASGQDLLEDLRRAQQMPYTTVFVMVTSEASYEKVAEAAEAALDGYLLKPHSARTLAERLTLARRRKKVLAPIFAAIESQEFELAVQLCVDRFRQRTEYWLYAARVGAELLLRLRRHGEARALYEEVNAAHPQGWARLGIARAQMNAGDYQPATRTPRISRSLSSSRPATPTPST